MRRTPLLVLLLSLIVTIGWLGASDARADSESIRRFDVTLAVQADGSMDVRYELDWHFPEKGRHGINFGIATREPWEGDDSKDAVYQVDDVRVSSPSGAPAQFTESIAGEGSRRRSLELRIGDPAVELDTQDATYVIEYTIDGALRTFDSGPELFWDVSSGDFPLIEHFSATVTAPDGVTEARCLNGSGCEAEVANGEATYSGSDLRRAISVVAAIPEGSVRNAEPILEARMITDPELRTYHRDAEVRPDGSVHVTDELTYELPTSTYRTAVQMTAPARQPWSDRHDQVITISDIEAVDSLGTALKTDLRGYYSRDKSWQPGVLEVVLSPDALTSVTTTSFTVSYVVRGAVASEDGTARLRMPVELDRLNYTEDATWTYRFPAAVTGADCVEVSFDDVLTDECEIDFALDGDTVSTDLEGLDDTSRRTLVDISLPASAVPGAVAELEPSTAAEVARRPLIGGGVGAGTAALLAAFYFLVRRRDERYVGVPPGVVGDENNVKVARRTIKAPVRFNPPDVEVHEAGMIMDRGEFKPSHLTASLVAAAVAGVVRISSRPLIVQKGARPPQTVMEHVYRKLASNGQTNRGESQARRMRQALVDHEKDLLKEHGYLRRGGSTLQVVLFLLGFGLMALGVYLFIFHGTTMFIVLGLAAAGMASIFISARKDLRGLSARGTAMLDQIEGFRLYIRTAEAAQLNFEADHDVFRRYLPWAVLFGETERWARIGEQLAAAGHPEVADTSFLIGTSSLNSLGSDLRTFSSSMASTSAPPSSSSSGGSGSSSGFSGGSSGGGGGGGASGSSW